MTIAIWTHSACELAPPTLPLAYEIVQEIIGPAMAGPTTPAPPALQLYNFLQSDGFIMS